MKSILIAACILVMPFIGLAQNCKYDVNKNDPFTNQATKKRTINIGPKTINGKGNDGVGWTISFEKIGDEHFISFEIILFGKFDEVFGEGQKVFLKLENGQILELTSDKQTIPVYMTGYAVYTHYTPRFKVDAQVINTLSKEYVNDFKMQLGQMDLTAEINDRKADNIMATANCFK